MSDSDINSGAVNEKENFDVAYWKESEVQREMEKIEIAYSKMLEKYSGYSECRDFIGYVRNMERIFAEAKVRKWTDAESEDELIRFEIQNFSESSHIDPGIFHSIYEDFKRTSYIIGKVDAAVERLLEKHKDDPECCDFIRYLRFLYLNFQEVKEGTIDMEELKSRLIRARMDVLSSDGKPDLYTLQNIYEEFGKLINQ